MFLGDELTRCNDSGNHMIHELEHLYIDLVFTVHYKLSLSITPD